MLQRPNNKKLMVNVLEAAKACSIDDNHPCTINDIINLENYFKEYQILFKQILLLQFMQKRF